MQSAQNSHINDSIEVPNSGYIPLTEEEVKLDVSNSKSSKRTGNQVSIVIDWKTDFWLFFI